MIETQQIKELAESQLNAAKENVDEQRKRLAEAERVLEQIQAIVGVFNTHKKGKSKRRKPKNPANHEKKSVSQKQMMKACLSLVRDNVSVAVSDLQALAIDKLRSEINEDMKGASMRFSECMKSKNFVVDDKEMVSLAAVEPQSGEAAESPVAKTGRMSAASTIGD